MNTLISLGLLLHIFLAVASVDEATPASKEHSASASNERSLELAIEQKLVEDVASAGFGGDENADGGVFIKILDDNDGELFHGRPEEVQNGGLVLKPSAHPEEGRELQDDCGMILTTKCYWYDRYPDVKCHDFIGQCGNRPNLKLQITYIYRFRNAGPNEIMITNIQTNSRKSQDHMGRFEDQWWFPNFKSGQSSVVGENFEAFDVCDAGALDASITVTATMNGRQCRATSRYDVVQAKAAADATRTPRPTWPPTRAPSTKPTPYPSRLPTTQPTPRPNPVMEAGLQFVKKSQKNKSCDWLAQKEPKTVNKICRTRVLEPTAKGSCPWTCNFRCNPNDPTTPPHQACIYESINRFMHRRESRKSCEWLAGQPQDQRKRFCKAKAKRVCPAVCGGFYNGPVEVSSINSGPSN